MALFWACHSFITSSQEQSLKKEAFPSAKTLHRNIRDARCRQNSAEESPQHTAIRNTAGKWCLARALDPLQQGIPVGLLPYWRVPVPQPPVSLGPSSPQEHTLAALPEPKQEQTTIRRYLQLTRYITEQELKPLTIVLPASIAVIYSLYCAM